MPSKAEYIDYIKHRESTGRPVETTVETALGMIRTAAVSFDHLTGDEHWDRFLSHAQARLEEAKKEQATWLDICGKEPSEAGIRHAQMQYQNTCGYIRAVEEILLIPHQLRDEYQKLKKS